jgi:opacity protein-like surface antigen
MNMRKAILLLPLLLATASATPAIAQVSARGELKIGYDEPRARVRPGLTIAPEEFGFGGLAAGAEAGVDVNIGNALIVGPYVGADFSGAKGCVHERFFEGDEICMKSNRNLYAGLRAGLVVTELGLVYVKGGLSRGRFGVTFDDGDPNTDFDFSSRDTISGHHFGGGVEVNVSSNVYLKGEYIYTKYKDGFRDVLGGVDQVFHPSRHQLMAGVGFRLGGMAPPPPPVVEVAPPPPPAPEAPATQTCPDGSVILATDVCPPPPPPPPPPPTPGERGQ